MMGASHVSCVLFERHSHGWASQLTFFFSFGKKQAASWCCLVRLERRKDTGKTSICASKVTHACVLAPAVLATFGSFLLYSKIEDTGCDPSASVQDNATCPSSGADVFGAMLGTLVPFTLSPLVAAATGHSEHASFCLFQAWHLQLKVSASSVAFRKRFRWRACLFTKP